jgi:diaminopimelate epimerase
VTDGEAPATEGDAMFWKLTAEGNSYVVIDDPAAVRQLLPWVNDPRLGLGGDGLLLRARDDGLLSMRVFNADGSEAPMCGNGARCLAALDFQSGIVPHEAEVTVMCGDFTIVHRLVHPRRMLIEAHTILQHHPLRHGGPIADDLWQLHVGTPHLVAFRDFADVVPHRDGPALERSLVGGTNVMFTAVSKPGLLDVIPWERGVGPAFGCATGAAAAAIAAAQRLPAWPMHTEVNQPGGRIGVDWDPRHRELRMRGCARAVAHGRLALY